MKILMVIGLLLCALTVQAGDRVIIRSGAAGSPPAGAYHRVGDSVGVDGNLEYVAANTINTQRVVTDAAGGTVDSVILFAYGGTGIDTLDAVLFDSLGAYKGISSPYHIVDNLDYPPVRIALSFVGQNITVAGSTAYYVGAHNQADVGNSMQLGMATANGVAWFGIVDPWPVGSITGQNYHLTDHAVCRVILVYHE